MAANQASRPGVLERARFGMAMAWLTLVLGLSLTGLAWWHTRLGVEKVSRVNFDFQADEVLFAIKTRMKAYEQVLHGAAGLFAASRSVERDEWRAYVNNLQLGVHFPGIQGLGFSQLVPAAEKAAHIRHIRAEGFPNYAIRPETDRPQYTSIIYLEPFDERNQLAFGYDMFTEPARRAAMEQARNNNMPVVSAKVTLVQEGKQGKQPGFLMYLPVYRNGMPHDTWAQRRANLVGYVYSAFRVYDLMDGIFGIRKPALDMEIFDDDNASGETLLYDSDSSGYVAEQHEEKPRRFSRISRIEINGRIWTIHFSSLPSFDTGHDGNDPIIVLTLGTIISILLFMITTSLATTRSRALSLANRMTRALQESDTRFRNVVEHIPDIVMRYDRELRFVYVNAAVEAVSGLPPEYYIGKTHKALGYPEPLVRLWDETLQEVFQHGQFRKIEFILHIPQGERYFESKMVPELDETGHVETILSVTHDITERKAVELHMRDLAYHDALTGLPNRLLLEDRIAQALAIARRKKNRVSLLFLDLDNFKKINDTLGHQVGDLLLQAVASRLKECVREGDTVARLAGDEFVIVLQDLTAIVQAAHVAEKIAAAVAVPYRLGGHDVLTTASIGASIYPQAGEDSFTLMKHADTAMYHAKQNGRNGYKIYTADMTPEHVDTCALDTCAP